MSANIRVLIADDHPIFRQGLRAIIEAQPDLTVIGEASDGGTALGLLTGAGAAVAVLDLTMPVKDGFAVARAVRELRLPTAIVFLTMHNDEQSVNAALDLGVRGYVLKDNAITEIVDCLRIVAAGRDYISPSLSSFLINRRGRATRLVAQKPALDQLTPAERRVLKLIADGLTSRAIADQLGIGVRTVEHHRNNVAVKLELRGSHALTKFALRHQSDL
ncbi:MAG: response regulator transcription factor [Acidobacteria bacterium]|nr:response regulator transcription factor [Acidobacteriota bacterium]